MKRFTWFATLMLAAAVAGGELLVPAAGSEVRVSGTSTMHDWTMIGKQIDGEAELAAALAAGVVPATVVVRIPVASVLSEKDKMNTLMREALGAEANPEILYRLETATVTTGEGGHFTVQTTGQLTIKGTTKDVSFDVAGERTADGGLVLTGEVPVRMTDYGVKPPVAMFGAIKTKPDAVVSFRWVLVPAPGAP